MGKSMAQESDETDITEGDERLRRWMAERTGKVPTDEDVREAKQNLVGFFSLIKEWIIEDRRKDQVDDQ